METRAPSVLERVQQIGSTLVRNKTSGLSVNSLLDSFLVLYNECTSPELRRDKSIAEFVKQCALLLVFFLGVLTFRAVEPLVQQIRQQVVRRDDFDTVKIIGRGAFGEVHSSRACFRQLLD